MQPLGYATELFDVVAFSFAGKYALRLRFDDESERFIDFAPILQGPVWGVLRDMEIFRQVRLDEEIGTLVWPGGLDIDPTVLHDWPQHVSAILAKRERQVDALAQLSATV